MFGALSLMLEASDEAAWDESMAVLLGMGADGRRVALVQLHHLAQLVGKAVRKLEEKTNELQGLLWKRKKKMGLSGLGAKSSHRMCYLRPDGLHYYSKENPQERLGVLERSQVESVAVLEGNPRTFEVHMKNGVAVEFTAETATAAREWAEGLRPDAGSSVAVREGWLMKKKQKKGGAKKRYCVLVSDSLKYFDDKGGRCLGAMPLADVTVSMARDGDTQAMKLVHGGQDYLFSSAAGGDDVADWNMDIARLQRGRGKGSAASASAAPKSPRALEVQRELAKTEKRANAPSSMNSESAKMRASMPEVATVPVLVAATSARKPLPHLASAGTLSRGSSPLPAKSKSSGNLVDRRSAAEAEKPTTAAPAKSPATQTRSPSPPPAKALPKFSRPAADHLLDEDSSHSSGEEAERKEEQKRGEEYEDSASPRGTSEMLAEMDLAEAQMEMLMASPPPAKRLPPQPGAKKK